MAATVQNRKYYTGTDQNTGAALMVEEIEVTFTGVTAYTWTTKMRKVRGAGITYNSLTGTGGGTVTPSTTTDGQVDIAGFTAGDVQTFFAIGTAM